MARPLKHLPNDFLTALAIINLLDDPLVNGLTLASKTRRQLERRPLSFRHDKKLLHNRFNQLDRTRTSLDMMIIVMTIFLDTVQRIFILVLPVRNKARIFRFPSWMRRPRVIQNGIAQLIATAAGLLPLAFG